MKSIFTFISILFISVRLYAGNIDSLKTEKKIKADSSNSSQISLASDSSINISKLVQMQILAAQKKENEKANKPVLNVETKKVKQPNKLDVYFLFQIRKMIPLSDTDLFKTIVMLSFSLIVFGSVFIKRKISNKKNNKTKLTWLKKNISLMREEKPIKVGKPDKLKKSVRKKLLISAPAKLSTESISKAAKEFQISKGEILLASRIKNYELNKEFFAE